MTGPGEGQKNGYVRGVSPTWTSGIESLGHEASADTRGPRDAQQEWTQGSEPSAFGVGVASAVSLSESLELPSFVVMSIRGGAMVSL